MAVQRLQVGAGAVPLHEDALPAADRNVIHLLSL